MIRTVDGDLASIKQMLDIGAQTLLIPIIDSAEQATRALRATRYPPDGICGFGAARAWGFAGVPDYLTTVNAQICVLMRVESRAGFTALHGILAVNGLDGVLIGPSDLTADIGYPERPNASQVSEAVTDALGRIWTAGRAAGVRSTDTAYIDLCKEAGANFVGTGIDGALPAGAMRKLAKRYR